MNTFEQSEETAASLVLIEAQRHANSFAQPGDREAATVSMLVRALELADGHQHIKPQGDQN